jgi:hypothetical protein
MKILTTFAFFVACFSVFSSQAVAADSKSFQPDCFDADYVKATLSFFVNRSGAELAGGIAIEAPALRWHFLRVDPALR